MDNGETACTVAPTVQQCSSIAVACGALSSAGTALVKLVEQRWPVLEQTTIASGESHGQCWNITSLCRKLTNIGHSSNITAIASGAVMASGETTSLLPVEKLLPVLEQHCLY